MFEEAENTGTLGKKKSNTLVVTITAPYNLKKGETFDVEIELPKVERKPRGQLAGLSLIDMTDEQLKREIINANSVLYKATQRGASADTIAANQARVDAAKAEKARRTPAPVVTPTETADTVETFDAESAEM